MKRFRMALTGAALLCITAWAADKTPAGRTMVLEAATIEGKLKRPQVALINVDRRPDFQPIALTDLDAKKDALEKIDPAVFESRVYGGPFTVDKKPLK